MKKHRKSKSTESVERIASPKEKPLQSWKEIAAYLERDERTTRRWEQKAGLPIRRHGNGPRSSVYAYRSEIEAWRLAHEPRSTEAKTASFFLPRKAITVFSVVALLITIWFIKYGPILNPPNPFVEAAGGIVLRDVLSSGHAEGSPSPNEEYFAFVNHETGNIAFENIATGEQVELTDDASLEGLMEYGLWCAISPDGTSVAYDWHRRDTDLTELRLIGIDGSDQQTILGSDFGTYRETVAWSNDGKHIATILFEKDRRKLGWVSVPGGSVTVLKNLGSIVWPGKIFHSPDDRYLVYSYTSEIYPPNFDIFLVSTDGSGKTTAIVEHPANERVLGWIPGRDAILFLSDRSGTWDVWLQEIAGEKPIGDPWRIYTNIGNIGPIGFGKDGSYFFEVYSRWQNNYVTAIDPKSGKFTGSLTQPLVGYNIGLNWSPDGRFLVYSPVTATPEGPAFFEGSLCVREIRTGEERKVPCDLRGIFHISWSPDMNDLLVTGSQKRELVDNQLRESLYLVDPDNGRTRIIADKPGFSINQGIWTPDGRGVCYVVGNEAVFQRIETGETKVIYQNPSLSGHLALSPGGDWLALGLDSSREGSGLTIINLSSNEERRLLSFSDPSAIRGFFDWDSEGRHLYYVKSEGKKASSLWRIDPEKGVPEKLFDKDEYIYGINMHPSGKQLTFSEVIHETNVWVMEGLITGSLESE